VNEWPVDWHPVNAEEAQEYIDAHQNGEGDAELLIECASFLPINVTGAPKWQLVSSVRMRRSTVHAIGEDGS
jgi:hypothetical protein